MARQPRQGSGAYERFGAYVRNQRQMAQLTLRQLADLASISNPYLSSRSQRVDLANVSTFLDISGSEYDIARIRWMV